jgi:hypothetical protein
MKQSEITKILFTIGGIFTVVGSIAKLFNIAFAPYVFSVGVVFLIYIQLMYTLESKDADTRQRRLTRNGLFASLLLALAAYFMFVGSNSWVVAVLIYALSTLFLSFRGNSKY